MSAPPTMSTNEWLASAATFLDSNTMIAYTEWREALHEVVTHDDRDLIVLYATTAQVNRLNNYASEHIASGVILAQLAHSGLVRACEGNAKCLDQGLWVGKHIDALTRAWRHRIWHRNSLLPMANHPHRDYLAERMHHYLRQDHSMNSACLLAHQDFEHWKVSRISQAANEHVADQVEEAQNWAASKAINSGHTLFRQEDCYYGALTVSAHPDRDQLYDKAVELATASPSTMSVKQAAQQVLFMINAFEQVPEARELMKIDESEFFNEMNDLSEAWADFKDAIKEPFERAAMWVQRKLDRRKK